MVEGEEETRPEKSGTVQPRPPPKPPAKILLEIDALHLDRRLGLAGRDLVRGEQRLDEGEVEEGGGPPAGRALSRVVVGWGKSSFRAVVVGEELAEIDEVNVEGAERGRGKAKGGEGAM